MKEKQDIFSIRSETWINNSDFDGIQRILEETIQDFVESSDRIINIQVVERYGSLRFWIFVERTGKVKR